MTTLPPTSTSQISVKKLIVKLKEFHDGDKNYPLRPTPPKNKNECGVSRVSLEALDLNRVRRQGSATGSQDEPTAQQTLPSYQGNSQGKSPGNGFSVMASAEIWGLKSGQRSKETGRMSSAVDISI